MGARSRSHSRESGNLVGKLSEMRCRRARFLPQGGTGMTGVSRGIRSQLTAPPHRPHPRRSGLCLLRPLKWHTFQSFGFGLNPIRLFWRSAVRLPLVNGRIHKRQCMRHPRSFHLDRGNGGQSPGRCFRAPGRSVFSYDADVQNEDLSICSARLVAGRRSGRGPKHRIPRHEIS